MKQAKVVAILSVLLMLAVCIVPFNDTENGLDAAVGDGGAYEYRIVYDSSLMSSGSAAISVADMTAISHTNTDRLESMNAGSWTWDTTTGIGPFNSFYAAFDLTNGNAFYAILNPNDLTQTIDGTALNPIANYNIMWVLPTVYWSTATTTTTDDTLVLTNDSSKGTAYGHTIDGHVYKYIAIGVYEGSTTTIDGKTVLTSTSGTNPTVSQTRATFRTYAHNYTMDSSLGANAHSMVWNFYQWELYKYCSYALMENFNSQLTVGGGHTYGSTYVFQTGSLNALGPYAGYAMVGTANSSNGGQSAKLFIENAWGAINEFVDGIMFHYNSAGNVTAYIDTNSTPTDATATGTNVESKTFTTLSSSDFVSDINTDPQIWGYGKTAGGSATAGLTDKTYVNSSGDKVLFVGGNSYPNASSSAACGLSCANANSGTSVSGTTLGSRLAFIFDAGPASDPVDLTFNVDGTGYGTLSDGTQTGQTTITVADVTNGTTLTVSNNTLTVADTTPTTITATPTTSDDQYTYTFDGWYIGTTKITTSTTVSADTTINAKFTRTLTLHDAQVESNNTAWGTVSVGTLTDIPYGETFTVSDHTLTIYGQSVVAVESPDTVEFQYSFDGFETEGVKIVTGTQMLKDLTIRAIFTSSQLTYTVIIHSNNTDWGNVNVASITNVLGGSEFEVNGNSLKVAGTTVTATKHTDDAQYTYGFSGWYDALTGGTQVITGSTVIDNMEVYARFTATTNNYTVTIQNDGSGYGSVSPTTVQNVPYGTVITASTNTLNVNGTTVTATPETDTAQYDYSFNNWTVGQTTLTEYTVTGNTTITANFNRAVQTYTVNFESSNVEYGSVAPTFLGSVPYGSQFAVSNNTVTINGFTITATPAPNTEEFSYSFTGWSVSSGDTVTGTMTVTATFAQGPSTYTVTLVANNGEYGSITNPNYGNVPYGTVISVSDDELSVGSIGTSEAQPRADTSQYRYGFTNWTIDGTPVTGEITVTGNTTITANFTRETLGYTIKWVINGVETEEIYQYGETPTHADPVRANYTFAGWQPTIEMVTQDQTYTATFTPITYTVIFEGTGGTPDVNVATGSVETAIVLPGCTLEGNNLEGWYTEDNVLVGYEGADYFPTANITLYAHWTTAITYHFSLVYNANGGEGTPETQTYSTEDNTIVVYEFTISSVQPTYGNYKFLGWATSSSAEDAEYKAGDKIEVAANKSVTLYAVWEDNSATEVFSWLFQAIGILVGVGLMVGALGAIINSRNSGGDNLITIMITVVVGSILYVAVMLPIFGII